METPRTFSKLLINEPALQVLPSLACAIGLNEAMLLQQVHYWLLRPNAKIRDGRRWLYNSYPAWQEQFPFWSVSTIRRIIETLEKRGLLLSGNYNELKIDKTKWYTIDYEALEALSIPPSTTPPPTETNRPSVKSRKPSAQNEQTKGSEWADQQRKMSRPIPETNTETTTEINESGAHTRPPAQPHPDNHGMDETALFDGPKITPVSNTTVTDRTAPAKRTLPPIVQATPLPDIYPLTDEMRTWAAREVPALGSRIELEHAQFCDYYHSIAHDRKHGWRSDWRPVWQKWMREPSKYSAGPGRKDPPPPRPYTVITKGA